MLSYYKKVFLASLRFSFLDKILGFGGDLLGGFLGSAGSAAGSSLFGGGDSDNEQIAAEIKRQKDEAGSAETTSLKAQESIPDSIATRMGKFGNKMATKFTEDLASKFVGKQVDQLINPQQSALRRGLEDRQYTSARYPGVNAWELAGAGGASSSGQGGRAVSEPAQRTQRQINERQITSAQKVADIQAEPKLAEVHMKYRKSGLEQAQTDKAKAETAGTLEHNKWIPTLNNVKANLDRAKTFLTGTQDVAKQSEIKKIEASTKLELQKLVTEVQKSGIASHDKRIRENLKRVSNILTGTDTRAYITLGGAAAGALLRSLPQGLIGGALGFGKGGSKKK